MAACSTPSVAVIPGGSSETTSAHPPHVNEAPRDFAEVPSGSSLGAEKGFHRLCTCVFQNNTRLNFAFKACLCARGRWGGWGVLPHAPWGLGPRFPGVMTANCSLLLRSLGIRELWTRGHTASLAAHGQRLVRPASASRFGASPKDHPDGVSHLHPAQCLPPPHPTTGPVSQSAPCLQSPENPT